MTPRTSLRVVLILAATASGLLAQRLTERPVREHIPYDPTGTGPFWHADFDGDGQADLLEHRIDARWFLMTGDATGLFAERRPAQFPHSERAYAMTVADFDGDGVLDVAYSRVQSSTAVLGIALGDGTGNFPTSAPVPSVDLGLTHGLDAGDVDGDGDVDLLVVAEIGRRVDILRNDGGSWSVAQSMRDPFVPFGDGAHLVDLDDDGDLDAIGGQRLFINRLGTFDDETSARLPDGLGGSTVRSGDFDGDGRTDLLAAGTSASPLFLDDGTGVYRQTAVPPSAHGGFGIAAGDIDGDGDLDIVVGGLSSLRGPPVLLRNLGGANFEDASELLPQAAPIIDMELLDVDGDTDLDLLAPPRLYVNDGTAFIDGTRHPIEPTPKWGREFVVGDLNGDGHADVVASYDDETRVYLGDGVSGWDDVTATHFPPDQHRPGGLYALDLGDLDDDGDLDLAFGRDLLINDGSGRLQPDPISVGSGADVHLDDFDGDGDLDVLHLRGMLRNDGALQFTAISMATLGLPPFPSLPGMATADFDGDGDIDVFIGERLGQDRLFFNEGDATFVDVTATHWPSGPQATLAISPTDFEGDGDVDLLLGYDIYGDKLHVLVNDGGTFRDETASLPFEPAGKTGACADFDLDGDQDLLVSGTIRAPIALLERTPQGFVQLTGAWLRVRTGGVVTVADLDGDHDPDVLLGIPGSTPGMLTLRNHRRHLQSSQLARTGGVLRLDAYAGSGTGEVAAPILSPRLLATPIQLPMGSLTIDLQEAVVLPPSVPPAPRRTRWTIAVPASPALVGMSLYTQAVFGQATPSSWRLSNTVADRIIE
ncbi:MAG: VCBS repeat-containing protein [Planctomycetota bacterium]